MKCVGFPYGEKRCANAAGSSHSDLWCQECDDKRLASISKNLEEIVRKSTPDNPVGYGR